MNFPVLSELGWCKTWLHKVCLGICFKNHSPVLRMPHSTRAFRTTCTFLALKNTKCHAKMGACRQEDRDETMAPGASARAPLPRWWSWCCGRWRRGGRSGRCASPSPGAGSSGPPCAGAWGSCRGTAVGTEGWRGCPSPPCAPESPSCPAEQETAPLLTWHSGLQNQSNSASQQIAFHSRCN